MSANVLVVLPMKPFNLAKTRLAEALPDLQRERLVRALFLRTQRFFATQFREFDRLVVTPSIQVRGACDRLGAQCLLEASAEGLNAAAARAMDWATLRGYEQMLIVPGDVPVWVRGEVRQLLAEGERRDVVIARARDGGTNALLVRLPSRLMFRYGIGSCDAHARAAEDLGMTSAVLRLPFLAHDLDVPEDCLVLSSKSRVEGARP